MCIAPRLESFFGSMRKNSKGQPVTEIFKQLFYNFMDGTSRHLIHFDLLKKDAGYAGTIESRQSTLLSSHTVKRFYNAFSWHRIWLFRGLLQELFIWRLNLREPDKIELFIDTFVMDNDEAQQYDEFPDKGIPISYDVPKEQGTVISRLVLKDRVLDRRTYFDGLKEPVDILVGHNKVTIEPLPGACWILKLR